MPPVSTIKRLPPEIRQAINEQLAQGYTLDEVTAYVREMGVNVSRSAIGRYNAHRVKLLEEVRDLRISWIFWSIPARVGVSRR